MAAIHHLGFLKTGICDCAYDSEGQINVHHCAKSRFDRDAVWVVDSGGPKEPCVRLGFRSPCEGAILIGTAHCKVSCAKTTEPIEMPFGLWTRVGPRKHALDEVHNGATW